MVENLCTCLFGEMVRGFQRGSQSNIGLFSLGMTVGGGCFLILLNVPVGGQPRG